MRFFQAWKHLQRGHCYIITVAIITSTLLLHLLFHLFHSQPSLPTISIQENFPKAASARGPSDLPPIPHWNAPPKLHDNLKTPLFIGFSQNWPLLQQALISLLTAGWPASDIYIVDNTGTMQSNLRGNLSPNNPSYLPYDRLLNIFEVNVINTPTELSFAQYQNFLLYEALQRELEYYFWAHMDIVVLSDEVVEGEYQSFYRRALSDFRSGLESKHSWAVRFYSYDRLALVSTSALDALGGWDTSIPYYPSDCDLNIRMDQAGYRNPSPYIGQFYDVHKSTPDLEAFYHAQPGSAIWHDLRNQFSIFMYQKNKHERNTWQWYWGGEDEPYSYNSKAAQWVRSTMIDEGRKVFKRKWGTTQCRPDTRELRAWNQYPMPS